MKRFDDQVAVVTGAASGIGCQLAADLSSRGATVYGIDRHASPGGPPGLTQLVCDLAISGQYEDILTDIRQNGGPIDILANVAGVGQPISVLASDTKSYADIMQVNFFAPVSGTLHVLSDMVERGRGIVVNVSSDSVRTPIAGEGPYVASKAALSAFTEGVALEVRRHGVSVHLLYPGFVTNTAMGHHALATGMKVPPRSVRRTVRQVSAKTLASLGGNAIEINAAPVAKVGQIARIVAPRLFERAMAGRAMPTAQP